MALPDRLLKQMAPSELELIASEQLVEIVPLISMERTAFISVRIDCLTVNACCRLIYRELMAL
jgi:GINS complex subunit 2